MDNKTLSFTKNIDETNSYDKKAKPENQHKKLRRCIKQIASKNFINLEDELWNDLPKKWKITQDLLILPKNSFQSPKWEKIFTINKTINMNEFWKHIAECFKVGRIAQEDRVKSDNFRSPNLKLLFGKDPVVNVINNGVKYSYDITKCMFSWGNITEKLRIASFDCSNETVVDLFAGIGYFTLVYLVKARAKAVIACEWNPDSVQALRNNLKLNKCEDRCTILEGDNRLACPEDCADRVNLGLIPSSEASWETACKSLRLNSGGYLHIHGNVDIHGHEKNNSLLTSNQQQLKSEWIDWALYAQEEIKRLLNLRDEKYTQINNMIFHNQNRWLVTIEHIEYVKSYGPRVDHLVIDLKCKPTFELNKHNTNENGNE
jgi:tRNA wybutosine-synthesizing protein 2